MLLVGFSLPKHILERFRSEPFHDVLPISRLDELPTVVQNSISSIIC